MFELLPGSHLEIAKDKYNTQPTIFFLQTNIVTYNNSLVPGGDKRPCILRETWKPEVYFNIYDLTLPTGTSCKLKYSNPFCAHFLKKFHGFYNLTAHPKTRSWICNENQMNGFYMNCRERESIKL